MISRIEKLILVIILGDYLFNYFITSFRRFRKFDARNAVLLQIKVFDGKMKETIIATFFLKVAARPAFT